jgi:glycosyltransferase involved in cell wall biosynthesis
MNEMDEVWATSDWTAGVFKDAGVIKPVHTYRHGIDPIWTPRLRERGDKLRFLHVGEPAPRKGGQYALDAFFDAFGERDDVHLTIKGHHQHFVRSWQMGAVKSPELPNVTINTDNLSTEDMVKLFHEHDVLVYPSWGEGFGLIPLQALATGMPTICTSAWAPYKKYLHDLKLSSERVRSTWTYHPGKVYQPNYDQLVNLYRQAESDFFNLSHQFHKQTDLVHAEYNWERLTQKAFAHIVEMFS